MRIYITGVRGFLGTHLAKSLTADGHEVYGCDLIEPETQAWEALSDGEPIPPTMVDRGWIEYPGFVHTNIDRMHVDVVVHLAARSTVEVSFENPEAAFETNVLGTVRVLEACRKLKLPILVASTDKAYGVRRPPFYEEDSFKPRYPYDVSKANADMAALSYAKTYQMAVAVTRSCNFYGPGDLHWNRLVPRSFKELALGHRPVMYGAMERIRREWMHVSDCVEAYKVIVRKLLDDPEMVVGLGINIGTGDVRTLREMMQRILLAAGSDVEPIINNASFPELGDEWLDHRRLERLGWHAKVRLDDGLRETWEWYRNFCGGQNG